MIAGTEEIIKGSDIHADIIPTYTPQRSSMSPSGSALCEIPIAVAKKTKFRMARITLCICYKTACCQFRTVC